MVEDKAGAQPAGYGPAAWGATGGPASPAIIDPDLWPGVAQPPSGLKAEVAGKAAGLLFRGAAKRLPLRVEYPDGQVLGTGGPDAPVMTMVRPEAFETRINNDRDAEFSTATAQVEKIALLRLQSMLPEK